MAGGSAPDAHRLALTLFLAVAVYGGLYAVARHTHCLVHTLAWTYDGQGRRVVSLHQVLAGDARLASPNPIIYMCFAPVCWVEATFWRWQQPPGSPLP